MKLGIAGCSGRMGRALIELARAHPAITSAMGLVHDESEARDTLSQGGLLWEELLLTDSADLLIEQSDAVIDFTTPLLSLTLAEKAAMRALPLVCGTTGFSPKELAALKASAKRLPLLWSANMSVGVALLKKLAAQAAQQLRDYDIEILEMHHRHKVDSPSGTALALGEAVAEARGQALGDQAVYSREGQVGERPDGAIGFATLRGGAVIGDHTVILAGEYDRLELTHRSQSRHIYAAGALRAALWLKGQKPGFYQLEDMLNAD